MGAFIVAGIVFVCTLGLSALMLFAQGMSDNPSATLPVLPTFLVGTGIALAIAATHWLHLGW